MPPDAPEETAAGKPGRGVLRQQGVAEGVDVELLVGDELAQITALISMGVYAAKSLTRVERMMVSINLACSASPRC